MADGTQTDRLGIEALGVFGMPPVDFVHLTADLGCRYISIGLRPGRHNPHGYPPFSLRDDKALRRDFVAAMQDRGVSISLGEGIAVRADVHPRDLAEDLSILAELGAPSINVVSFDPDLDRSIEKVGILAELVAAAGMETMIEFARGLGIPDLPSAVRAVREIGRSDVHLVVDTMHLVRSGSGAEDVAALEPGLVGYVQLCDAPLVPTIPSYLLEVTTERMVPGTGELPLLDILRASPRDVVIGIEVPLRSEAEAGVSPHDRLGRCVDAARALLAELDDPPEG